MHYTGNTKYGELPGIIFCDPQYVVWTNFAHEYVYKVHAVFQNECSIMNFSMFSNRNRSVAIK